LYVSKMRWDEDPDENYWKFMRRPNPSYSELEAIRERMTTAEISAYSLFIGSRLLQNGSISVNNVFMMSVTDDYANMFKLTFHEGRFFSPTELHYGTDNCMLGFEVAEKLFPSSVNIVGRKIKVGGRNMTIVGVITKAGNDIFNPIRWDNAVVIPYQSARKFVNINNGVLGSSISVKAKPNVSMKEMEDELTGVLRGHRKLKPREESNFALNSSSVISNALDDLFTMLNSVGWFIGIFSLLVGMFGVANIMFVSVKERTGQIGIKKALGAKSFFILTEFLIEAVVLCIIGGILGLLLVWLASFAASWAMDFNLFLSFNNIALGVGIALITGIFAGLIPAYKAASMDPVEAMRR
jgi:putative ABC transport system permease protein